jgi:hypothetical protein
VSNPKIILLKTQCFHIVTFTNLFAHLMETHTTDRRWHSSILDVRLFRAADCDTDHYLVMAKVRERLAMSK